MLPGRAAQLTCSASLPYYVQHKCLVCLLPLPGRLEKLPLYSLGISSGASFALKMPRFLNFSGVLSEALGLDPKTWGYEDVKGGERAQARLVCVLCVCV